MPEAQNFKVGAEGFDESEVDTERLLKARQVWISLITTWHGSDVGVYFNTQTMARSSSP